MDRALHSELQLGISSPGAEEIRGLLEGAEQKPTERKDVETLHAWKDTRYNTNRYCSSREPAPYKTARLIRLRASVSWYVEIFSPKSPISKTRILRENAVEPYPEYCRTGVQRQ